MSYVNLKNARNDEQRRVMEMIQSKNICPFCEGQEQNAELEPIIQETEFWHLRKNRWPYPNTRVHLLAISRIHTETLADLSPSSFADLLTIFQKVEKDFAVSGGALALRFGEPSENGGTVRHLHVHFIVALQGLSVPEYQTVRFKVGPSAQK